MMIKGYFSVLSHHAFFRIASDDDCQQVKLHVLQTIPFVESS
jgi:hypothetical protein